LQRNIFRLIKHAEKVDSLLLRYKEKERGGGEERKRGEEGKGEWERAGKGRTEKGGWEGKMGRKPRKTDENRDFY